MAELLINMIDATHPDPAEDRKGCYKTGDIVVVMPDGHTWGDCECLPKFLVVKLPGVAVADIAHYVEPISILVTVDGPTPVVRRRYRINPLSSIGDDQLRVIAQSDWMVPEITVSVIEDKA